MWGSMMPLDRRLFVQTGTASITSLALGRYSGPASKMSAGSSSRTPLRIDQNWRDGKLHKAGRSTNADFGSCDQVCYTDLINLLREPEVAARFCKSKVDPNNAIVLDQVLTSQTLMSQGTTGTIAIWVRANREAGMERITNLPAVRGFIEVETAIMAARQDVVQLYDGRSSQFI